MIYDGQFVDLFVYINTIIVVFIVYIDGKYWRNRLIIGDIDNYDRKV